MEESTTYQLILSKGEKRGRVGQLHDTLAELGQIRFGIPDSATSEALQRITDLERLSELVRRVLIASSWQDLLS